MEQRVVPSPATRVVCAVVALLSVAVPGCAQDLVFTHAVVYPSPTAATIIDATVVVKSGTIVAVGHDLGVPKGMQPRDCHGCVVMAGFWNTHVHFTEPKWSDSAHLSAARLEELLQEMLTHSGFTTVVDTGSDPANTVAIRSRIESGEVRGPRIYTAGFPLYPPHAVPFYLADLPTETRQRLPQPATAEEAAAAVDRNIAAGSDITKLFTGSFVAPNRVVPMPSAIASAAAAEAHRHDQLVFAHASDLKGVRVAIDAGADVLAHAPEVTKGIDSRLLQRLIAHHVTIIPTLKLFSRDANIRTIRSLVGQFQQRGGRLMFGTDTGFLTDYDVSEEYRQLSVVGLNVRDILAMLTTTPAQRFDLADRKGRVAPGMDADLTILGADPADAGVAAFTQVTYTIRAGRVIFSSVSVPRRSES